MAFFSEAESASLRLVRMSLHLVGGDDDFIPQPELPAGNDDFLLEVLKEIGADSVYRFNDVSTTRDTVAAIAGRTITFELGAQNLAADFCRFHKGSARDGAFFVFELGSDDDQLNFFALVKYDYGQVLELIHGDEGTDLRRIVEAFVRAKTAIQKSVIIRARAGVIDHEISVRDRMGRPAPNLTDFFRNYLQVSRDRDDEELTEAAKEAVRSSLNDYRENLPPGKFAAAVSRGFDVLRNAEEISEQVIGQAVWVGAGQPEDDASKASLNKSVARYVKNKRLGDLVFAPDRRTLPRAIKRSVLTLEGVKIEYNTALDGQAVHEERLPDGQTRFTVTTRSYTDDVNANRTR